MEWTAKEVEAMGGGKDAALNGLNRL